jgi:hypothetical protein
MNQLGQIAAVSLLSQIDFSSVYNACSGRNDCGTCQRTFRSYWTSAMNAAWKNPDQVHTYIRSASHCRVGPSAPNCRSTTSRTWSEVSSGVVVRFSFQRVTPRRPGSRVNRLRVRRATRMPARYSLAYNPATPQRAFPTESADRRPHFNCTILTK